MKLLFLNFIIAFVVFVAIVQSYFCIDLKFLGVGYTLLGLLALFLNSKKIILEKSDILIGMLLILLNVYYTLVQGRGTIFLMPSYILILSIVLSKVVFPSISSKRYLRKLNTVYLILLIGLLVEYLLLFSIGSSIFRELLICNKPGVQGYRDLHNFTSQILSIKVPGLNSIMMGAQTASQLAVIIFAWYLYKYKVTRHKSDAWLAFLAIVIFILSPTVTTILMLCTLLVIIYLAYIKDIFQEKISSFNQFYVALIVSIAFIYFVYEVMIFRHQSITYIIEELILSHLSGFNSWSLLELVFGASQYKINASFYSTEIMFLQQLAMYGFVGFTLFYFIIFYYIFRVFQLRFLMNNNVLMLLPIIIIVILFVLGNIHYYVLFQAGVREFFALHLAYIIYQGSIMKRNSHKVGLI